MQYVLFDSKFHYSYVVVYNILILKIIIEYFYLMLYKILLIHNNNMPNQVKIKFYKQKCYVLNDNNLYKKNKPNVFHIINN